MSYGSKEKEAFRKFRTRMILYLETNFGKSFLETLKNDKYSSSMNDRFANLMTAIFMSEMNIPMRNGNFPSVCFEIEENLKAVSKKNECINNLLEL